MFRWFLEVEFLKAGDNCPNLYFNSTVILIDINVIVTTGAIIIRNPAGSPVLDQPNTYHYPLLSNITLTCMTISENEIPLMPTSYHWNTTGCYTNPSYNSGNQGCFPNGRTTRDVTGYHLTAKDAGTITCSVMVSGHSFTSNPITLQISGISSLCPYICSTSTYLINSLAYNSYCM